jgi:hypothetical protein
MRQASSIIANLILADGQQDPQAKSIFEIQNMTLQLMVTVLWLFLLQ